MTFKRREDAAEYLARRGFTAQQYAEFLARAQEPRQRRPHQVPKRRKVQAMSRREIRAQCMERADGHCEKCGRAFTMASAPQMDHFRGRAKVPESVENCWMLCFGCNREKTDNVPNARHWAEAFLQHAERHDYKHGAELARAQLARLDAMGART